MRFSKITKIFSPKPKKGAFRPEGYENMAPTLSADLSSFDDLVKEIRTQLHLCNPNWSKTIIYENQIFKLSNNQSQGIYDLKVTVETGSFTLEYMYKGLIVCVNFESTSFSKKFWKKLPSRFQEMCDLMTVHLIHER